MFVAVSVFVQWKCSCLCVSFLASLFTGWSDRVSSRLRLVSRVQHYTETPAGTPIRSKLGDGQQVDRVDAGGTAFY